MERYILRAICKGNIKKLRNAEHEHLKAHYRKKVSHYFKVREKVG
jgi:hypothetical protein